jgi:isocitrate lyase
MGGKVLVPTAEAVNKLHAARLAADVCGVPTILVARTDAESANLLTSDVDERDHPFIEAGDRTSEGFFRVKAGLDQAIARGLAYAPYADLIWCETGVPDLEQAKAFAEGIHKHYPDQLLCRAAGSGVRPESEGYTATKHQREVGAGYFDAVTQVVTQGSSSLSALSGSTEEEQFKTGT